MSYRAVAAALVFVFAGCAADFSQVYFDMAHKTYSEKNADEAVKIYESTVTKNVHSPDYYNARGDIYYHFGRYGEAVNDYTRSIRDMSDPAVNIKRGRAYMRLQYFEDAVVDFTTVIDSRSKDMYTAYVERAKAYLELGKTKEALKDLDKAQKRGGDSADVYVALGEIYFKLGELDRSKMYVQKAIDVNSNDAGLYLLRGKLFYRSKDANQAIADMKKALEADPNLTGAKIELARIYATCPIDLYRNGSEAVRLASEVYNMSENPDALIYMAAGYAGQGNFDKAAGLLEKSIDKTKDYVKQDDMRVYMKAYTEKRKILTW